MASALVMMMLVGCGDDDGGGTVDARPAADAGGGADARPADGGGGPDAQAFSGTIQVHDISLFGLPQAGHGGSIEASFGKAGVPSFMSAGSSGIPPCNAVVVDNDNPLMANPDLNEGTVKIEIKTAAGASARTIPDCVFANGDYRCISGMGSAATIGAGPSAGLYTFMGTGTTAATAGQYVVITGGAGIGTALPIVNVPAAMTLIVASLTGAAPPGTTGAWITAAGLGPVPGAPPPEFIANDETVKVTLTGATGTHYGNVATGDIPAGDEFELDDATAAMLTAGIDLNSATPLMFGCKKTVGGTACPAAQGTIINIQSTDATSFTGPTDMGTPDQYSGNLTCAAFAETVSIPINLLAVLRAGNPTKLRITVLRDGFSPVNGMGNSINVVAGHAIVAFQEL